MYIYTLSNFYIAHQSKLMASACVRLLSQSSHFLPTIQNSKTRKVIIDPSLFVLSFCLLISGYSHSVFHLRSWVGQVASLPPGSGVKGCCERKLELGKKNDEDGGRKERVTQEKMEKEAVRQRGRGERVKGHMRRKQSKGFEITEGGGERAEEEEEEEEGRMKTGREAETD